MTRYAHGRDRYRTDSGHTAACRITVIYLVSRRNRAKLVGNCVLEEKSKVGRGLGGPLRRAGGDGSGLIGYAIVNHRLARALARFWFNTLVTTNEDYLSNVREFLHSERTRPKFYQKPDL